MDTCEHRICKYPTIRFTCIFCLLTISTALVDIGGHALGDVLGTNVALSAQKELNVFLGGAKNSRVVSQTSKGTAFP